MPKTRSQPDVLVVGSHPCCYLATALLHERGVPAMQASIPGHHVPDRLVLINPKFFDLHKLTAPLKKSPDLSPIFGLKFLADDGKTSSEFVAKSIAGYVTAFKQICTATQEQARKLKVEVIESKTLEISGADETGVDVMLNGSRMRPKMLIVGGELPPAQRKVLGLPEQWDAGVLRRYTFVRLKGAKWIDPSQKQTIPMSLDLHGQLYWAWLLPGHEQVQIAVEQPVESIGKIEPKALLQRWIDVLTKHNVLKPGPKPLDEKDFQSMEFPSAGALHQEGVANRALLIGPAGGFYTACAEDIYPNCWSALFAAEVASKAIKERHLQDALGAYRETWGSTLGDYLRGPQENLRFLLPLVYRNPVMTSRMGEAILSGESVVR
jgi:flavin-dependent dehydrogenase